MPSTVEPLPNGHSELSEFQSPTEGTKCGVATTNGTNGSTNGYTNGHADGYANGQTSEQVAVCSNGYSNGHSDDHAIGFTNGHTNGHANGHTNGQADPRSKGKSIARDVQASPEPTVAEAVRDLAEVDVPQVSGTWEVDKVLAVMPDAPIKDSTSPVPFFHILERLKTTKREGWRRFNIMRGESISDHMYRMALLSMVLPPSIAAKADMTKCMKMSLIHDMAELLVGDITPVDGVTKPEKSRREAESMDFLTGRLLGNVNGGANGSEIRAVWQEYEDSQTYDSKVVHDLDKVELLLQMVEYEKRGGGSIDLHEFTWVADRIALPEIRAWADELLAEHETFWGRQPQASSSNDSSDRSIDITEVPPPPATVTAEAQVSLDECTGQV